MLISFQSNLLNGIYGTPMGNLLGAKNLGQHMEVYGMSHSEECFQNSTGELVCVYEKLKDKIKL